MKSISKYFTLQELVPEAIYKQYGSNSRWFVDPRLISLLDTLREHFKAPITVNNWSFGGKFQERGFRHPNSTTGGRLSQHKFGRAADISVKGRTPRQVYDEILANEKFFLEKGLTTLEDIKFTPTWVHIDIRDTGFDKVLIVKP